MSDGFGRLNIYLMDVRGLRIDASMNAKLEEKIEERMYIQRSRLKRSEKGPPVASVSVLRIVAISGKGY